MTPPPAIRLSPFPGTDPQLGAAEFGNRTTYGVGTRRVSTRPPVLPGFRLIGMLDRMHHVQEEAGLIQSSLPLAGAFQTGEKP